MLVAIDIGNTNVVAGLFEKTTLKDHIRLPSRRDMTADEAGFLLSTWLRNMDLQGEVVESVAIASVVPVLTGVLEQTAQRYLGCRPIVLTHKLKLPVTIDIDQPEQLGADRIANAAAGYSRYGGPLIVVDFGTATTFDVVTGTGAYIGGIIMPGPETSMRELASRAARLFEVRVEKPAAVVGRTTSQALQSGLFYGTTGQIDYMIERIIEETKFENCRIVATGGLAGIMQPHSRRIGLVDVTLTLEGLRIIAEMN